MPRYHFDVYADGSTSEAAGRELSDIHAARKEGSRIIGDLFRDEHEGFWTQGDWRMEVTDPAGLLLLRVDVITTESPAVRGS